MEKALIFYSRIPDEHIVGKTRIGRAIGNQEIANELARSLILDMLAYYMQFDGNEYDLIFYHKGHKGAFGIKNAFGVKRFYPTIDAGLGPNMYYIFQNHLPEYTRIVMIGSDVPLLTIKQIRKAFRALKTHDAVISPVEDKGYSLIAMSKLADIFTPVKNFDSRTPGYDLMRETRALCKKQGLKVKELSTIFDIDEPADVQRLWNLIQKKGKLLKKFSYLEHTFPFLAGHKQIFNLSD
ncbi:DUF2064 domain-containing protein [Candidatus Nomurabacteria bacterium]|nr:DUF2064 domain-containing protein [Candidatus Nomurabacteria bacterium]